MSEYYDADRPFSIENWNKLIRDVNDILQNPPEGSINCQPVDTIDEVEDPHIWAVEDVEEVRDKLKETCPDISFGEELVLWKTAIIDEIEEQMEDAWCDCETEPDEETQELYSFSHEVVVASPWEEACCGNQINSAPCYICVGQHCRESQYIGDFYPLPMGQNEAAHQQIKSSFPTAKYATSAYIYAVNDLIRYGGYIEQTQGSVDLYVDIVDSEIAEYEANCLGEEPSPECPHIQQRICTYGQEAREAQGRLDGYVENFRAKYDVMTQKRQEADGAAAENWAAAASIVARFPIDKNIIAECLMGALDGENWGDWFDPAQEETLGYGAIYVLGMWWGPESKWVDVNVYRQNTRYGDRKLDGVNVFISPNGTPFVSWGVVNILVKDYSLTKVRLRHRWRCESLVGWQCEPEPGNCNFPEWGDYGDWWWSQGYPLAGQCGGFACWIWDPLPPGDPSEHGTDAWYMDIIRPAGRKGTDKTQEQEEFYQKYLNWYDEHPQYDDRHESYC